MVAALILNIQKQELKHFTVHLDVCHNWDQLNHHKYWHYELQNNQYLMYNT
jgi:hypothetical protein